MNEKENPNKAAFVRLYLKGVENESSSKDIAKAYLESEGVNTNRLVVEGMQKIKKMQMLAEAAKTEKEMSSAESVKAAATAWVDQLLAGVDFSLPELVKKEELSMSFRNVDSLSQEDIRNILIKHFTLKFMKGQNNNPT